MIDILYDEGVPRTAASRRAAKLALALASYAWALPAVAQLPPPPKELTVDENNVDVRTGNKNYTVFEVGIGPSNELRFELNLYNSAGIGRDSFDSTYYYSQRGTNWSESASIGNAGDGQNQVKGMPGAFIINGFMNTNVAPEYQQKNGIVTKYGVLIVDQWGEQSYDHYRIADSVVYPNGLRLELHYKIISGIGYPLFRLQSVTSNAGYQIKFRYGSDVANTAGWNVRTSAVALNMAVDYCDPSADVCAYSRSWPTATYSNTSSTNPTTNVTEIQDAGGGVTRLKGVAGYAGAKPYTALTLPGTATDAFKYTTDYMPMACEIVGTGYSPCAMGDSFRVTQAVTPDGTTTYTYNYSSGNFNQIIANYKNVRSRRYTSSGESIEGPRSYVDELNRETKLNYDVYGNVTKAVWPELNRTEWTRDANGNVTEENSFSKDSSLVLKRKWSFGSCGFGIKTCGMPLTMTEANGAVTTYKYNDKGQRTVELKPADASGIRALRRWFYEDRYASVKGPSGALVAAATPISMLTREITCRSTFNNDLEHPGCASSADETVINYEYGAAGTKDALLVHGMAVTADGITRRTCYTYDSLGNRVSETKPRAGLSSCP